MTSAASRLLPTSLALANSSHRSRHASAAIPADAPAIHAPSIAARAAIGALSRRDPASRRNRRAGAATTFRFSCVCITLSWDLVNVRPGRHRRTLNRSGRLAPRWPQFLPPDDSALEPRTRFPPGSQPCLPRSRLANGARCCTAAPPRIVPLRAISVRRSPSDSALRLVTRGFPVRQRHSQ